MTRSSTLTFLSLAMCAFFGLPACHSLGPKSIRKSHGAYGNAIALSQSEQFLQNLVRLRYRESPYFLEVGSVTASLGFESSLGVGSGLSTGPGPDSVSPSLGASFENSPTISYSPLQGEDFLKKVLVTVPVESLFVLIQSGWSAKRVFGICVERINGIYNAPTASGPTPKAPPRDTRPFERLLDLLDRVRGRELVRYTLDEDTGELIVQFDTNADEGGSLREIKELLNLKGNENTFVLTTDHARGVRGNLSVRSRSIMSILFYLSQNVEVPLAHEEQGLVTVTRRPDGERFDWNETPAGRLFQIRQSAGKPDSAFIAIPYRDHWFYIADDDLDSKATFMLVSQLFRLNAGAVQSVSPTLTIPVGG